MPKLADDVPFAALDDADIVMILAGLDCLQVKGPAEVNMWITVRNKIQALKQRGDSIAEAKAEAAESQEAEAEAEDESAPDKAPELAPEEVAGVTEG